MEDLCTDHEVRSSSPFNLPAREDKTQLIWHTISRNASRHGTDCLHHVDYHVPPLHPTVVLHSLDLSLACHIRCSTLVSKLTFSPGPFLHSFSNNPLARLHGYLTIAGVGTSLTEFGSVWQIKLALLALRHTII